MWRLRRQTCSTQTTRSRQSEVRHWTGTTEESIRNRCGAPYASVFRAKGRGLPPSDELNTKIAYILDDLIFKARSGHFS